MAQMCPAGTITRAGGIWRSFDLSAPKSGSANIGISDDNLPGSQVFPEAGETPFGA